MIKCHICQKTFALYENYLHNSADPDVDNNYINDNVNCVNNHFILYCRNSKIISYEILYREFNKEYIIRSSLNRASSNIGDITVVYEKSSLFGVHKNMNLKIIFKINVFFPLEIKDNVIQGKALFDKIKLLNMFS